MTPPPTITAGGNPSTAVAGGAAVAVDPGVTVTDTGPDLTTASVSINANFTASEDQLLFTDQNGITGSYDATQGILTLTGSANAATYQAALRSVEYQDTAPPATANQSARSITISVAPPSYDPANGHFYVFVADVGITWPDAKAAADASNLYGLQGYLATLTSQAEDTFAFSKTETTSWIGASDAGNVGHWDWVDGPENGLYFYQGLGASGAPVNGQYSNWNAGEPNDLGGSEFYAELLQTGLWNDQGYNGPINGYTVEYGGTAGDPTLQLTSQATVNVTSTTPTPTVTTPAAPTTVNALNATITGTAAAGSVVMIYNDLNNNGTVDAGETLVGSEQLAAGQTTYTITVALNQNTDNHFLVDAIDSPSTVSGYATVPTITEDSIAPAAPTVTSPASAESINATTAPITGTAEAGSLVQILQDGVVVGTEQLGAGQTTYSITVPLTPNTANNFGVTSTDAAGNVSPTTAVPTITEDSIAPAAPTVTSPASAESINATTAPITGTAEAGSLVTIYQGEVVVGTEQLGAGQTTYSITVPLTANAANNFGVTATDAAGNVSPTTAVPTITEDSIAPAAPTVTSPAAPVITKATTQPITGTAEAGSLVQILQDGVVVGTEQLGDGQTTYSITVPLTPNAANNFGVTATDAAGNVSPPTAVPTITEDSIAPAAPTVTSPASAESINATTAPITGTAEAGSLVTIYSGSTVVGTEQLGAGQTTYSITVPLTPNTANNFGVTATDAAGNVSPTTAVPTITEDSIAPAAPTVTSPASAESINATTAPITGTAEAGSLVTIYSGSTVVGTEQLGDGQTTYSITVPLTANAANNFAVTATDAAGNASRATAVPTITEDSIAPAAPTVTSPASAESINATTAPITGTAEAGSLVTILQGGVVVGTEQLGDGQTTYSITVPLTPNAANNFGVTATDAGGNVSPTTAVPTITEDSIAPAAPTVTSPASAESINATTAPITGTAEAGSLVTIYSGSTVVGTEQLGAGQTTYSITVPLTANAANNFAVTATDAAGNASRATAVPTITEDSIAPAAPVVTSPSAATTVNATTEAITGTAEAGSLVQIYQLVGGVPTLVGTEQLAAGATTFSITVPLTANAANNFDVTATDAAGNVSPTATVPTVTEDSIAPAAPVVTSPSSATTVNATTEAITGTAEAGSLVTILQGGVVVGTEQLSPGQTTYSITVPLTANAANNFGVTSTDAAGNVSPTTAVPTVTEDSIAPASPVVTSPSSATTVNATTEAIAGTAEAGSLVTIYSGSTVVGTEQLAPGQTSFSIVVPLAPHVANSFTVTATDAAGNASRPTVVPTITEGTLSGTVYHDLNADGELQAGEPGLSGRVVFLDLNHDGTFDAGDPTATTDANGNFTFTAYAQGAAPVLELTAQDNANRYVVDQYLTNADGTVGISVTPISPIAPVPVVPNPFVSSVAATDANTAYVESLYRSVLGRTGSAAEASTWVSALAGGATHATVANGFVNSVEHRTSQVNAFYQEYLHRAADPGSAYWVNELLSGVSEEKVSESILESTEYQSAHQSQDLLIRDLYLDVLGRVGEDAGVASWKASFASGLTIDQLVTQFVEGDEAVSQVVNSFYSAYLRRQPEAVTSGAQFTMLQGAKGSATVSANGILSSAEFIQDSAQTTTVVAPGTGGQS